jgi:hypothetical protein
MTYSHSLVKIKEKCNGPEIQVFKIVMVHVPPKKEWSNNLVPQIYEKAIIATCINECRGLSFSLNSFHRILLEPISGII